MTHALLIDGENLSSAHAPAVLAEVPPDARVRRVYGDAARLNGWLSTGGLRPVHSIPGKNAADILLAIDAMELFFRDGLRNFVIATSDGGLVQLVLRLREGGASVVVMGSEQAGDALRAGAHRFVELASVRPVHVPAPKPVAALEPVEIISRWIGATAMPMADLSRRLQKERPRDLADWLGSCGPRRFLEEHLDRFIIDRTGSMAMVRLASKGAPPPP